MPVEIVRVELQKVAEVFHDWLHNRNPNAGFVCIFGGDSLTCLECGFLARSEGEVVGMMTLSRNGESGQGPQIVGIYVEPEFRRQGIARQFVFRALEYFSGEQVHIDVLSPGLKKCIETLPCEAQARLVVANHSAFVEGMTQMFP